MGLGLGDDDGGDQPCPSPEALPWSTARLEKRVEHIPSGLFKLRKAGAGAAGSSRSPGDLQRQYQHQNGGGSNGGGSNGGGSPSSMASRIAHRRSERAERRSTDRRTARFAAEEEGGSEQDSGARGGDETGAAPPLLRTAIWRRRKAVPPCTERRPRHRSSRSWPRVALPVLSITSPLQV